MIYHTVYKTTNNINGKFYIGVHSTKNVNDAYFGTGTGIKDAINKYGKDNFTKTIIHICETSEYAYELEELIVDLDFVRRKDTYNKAIGGKGARHGMYYALNIESGITELVSSEELKFRDDLETRKHTDESKIKQSLIKKDFYANLTPEERKLINPYSPTEEVKEKIAIKQRGVKRRPRTQDEKDRTSSTCKDTWNAMSPEERKSKGRTQTDEIKEKISNSSRKPKELSDPCPHCGLIGGKGSMTRYHFNNCKFKKET